MTVNMVNAVNAQTTADLNIATDATARALSDVLTALTAVVTAQNSSEGLHKANASSISATKSRYVEDVFATPSDFLFLFLSNLILN